MYIVYSNVEFLSTVLNVIKGITELCFPQYFLSFSTNIWWCLEIFSVVPIPGLRTTVPSHLQLTFVNGAKKSWRYFVGLVEKDCARMCFATSVFLLKLISHLILPKMTPCTLLRTNVEHKYTPILVQDVHGHSHLIII